MVVCKLLPGRHLDPLTNQGKHAILQVGQESAIKVDNIVKLRYFEVTALGLDCSDTRYDKSGAGFSYSSLIRATDRVKAEQEFRTDKRFRRMCGANGEDWATVTVVVDRISADEFSSDLRKERKVSYRRQAFLNRTSCGYFRGGIYVTPGS